jgi:hypothetical protein
LGFGYDPSMLGDFRRVERSAHFIGEELTSDVAHQLEQLSWVAEEFSRLIELSDPASQRTQQCFEAARAVFAVRLFCHWTEQVMTATAGQSSAPTFRRPELQMPATSGHIASA